MGSVLQRGFNSHYWNPEVARRLNGVGPRVLAIDGQSVVIDNLVNGRVSGIIPEEDRNFIWLTMPAWPSIVNPPQKDIFVATGDFDPRKLSDLLIKVTGTESPESKDTLVKWARGIEDNGFKSVDDSLSLGSDIFDLGGRAFGAISVYKLYSELSNHWEDIFNNPSKYFQQQHFNVKTSRRLFLAASALGAGSMGALLSHGGLSLLRNRALNSASHATTEDDKNHSQTFARMVRPRFRASDWLDARTAMLIAKANSATIALQSIGRIDKTNGVRTAVIMGDGHDFRADEFLGSMNRRQDTIRKFAIGIINDLEAVTRGFLNFPLSAAKKATLDYLAYLEMVRVQNPVAASVSNPKETVGKLIEMIASVRSAEILEAVKGI